MITHLRSLKHSKNNSFFTFHSKQGKFSTKISPFLITDKFSNKIRHFAKKKNETDETIKQLTTNFFKMTQTQEEEIEEDLEFDSSPNIEEDPDLFENEEFTKEEEKEYLLNFFMEKDIEEIEQATQYLQMEEEKLHCMKNENDPPQILPVSEIIESKFNELHRAWIRRTLPNAPIFSEKPERDWTGETTRVANSAPSKFKDWWIHLNETGQRYYFECLDETVDVIKKQIARKELYHKNINKLRAGINKSRKERRAKQKEDQKLAFKQITPNIAFVDRFAHLLNKIPPGHPQTFKILNCARLIDNNPSFRYKQRIIALHILLERFKILPKKYMTGIKDLPLSM